MNKIIPAALAAALAAPAGAVLLDFNAAPLGQVTQPYVEDGFRVTAVSGRMIVADPLQPGLSGLTTPDGSPFLAWVTQLAQPVGLPRIRLDHFGDLFTIGSFDTLGIAPPGLLTSSKGGSLGMDGNTHITLSGSEWSNVEWVEIFLGGPTGDFRGWDNVSLSPSRLSSPADFNTVPEPSTLALLSLGSLGLVAAGRRSRKP